MLNSQRAAIEEIFSAALRKIGAPTDTKIVLERPKQASHGDIACTNALQLAKALRKSPREIAGKIVEIVEADEKAKTLFKKIEIAGPGFINLTLSDAANQAVVKTILLEKDTYGQIPISDDKTILIEYVSANPTGPLHLGHARQAALGDVLCNLFRSQGWKVTREFYYNDAGVQITKLAVSVQARAKELLGENVVFPEDGYHGEYIKEIARQYLNKEPVVTFDGNTIESKGDPDDLETIRKYSVAVLRNRQHADLTAFGVKFDNYFLESSLYSSGRVNAAVEAMTKLGKTYEKDGALWFKSTDYGDDKDRAVRKSDGTYTYFVPDVAYHFNKFQRGFRRALNIQGTDHFGTMARVRAGLQAHGQALGIDIPKNFPEYLLHTMIHLIKDGEEVKMSKRSGIYVTLNDLIYWIGKDAARLFMVSRKCDAEFNLDIDLARSQSDENPVYYLQYAHARICSIFAQTQEKEFALPQNIEDVDLTGLVAPTEISLTKILSDYPETLQLAVRELAPQALVNYLSELASAFHSFYSSERVLILEESLRNARLALLMAVRQVLRNGLSILGISAPERLDRTDGN